MKPIRCSQKPIRCSQQHTLSTDPGAIRHVTQAHHPETRKEPSRINVQRLCPTPRGSRGQCSSQHPYSGSGVSRGAAMSKKQFSLGEDNDEALMRRIDVVARERGFPSLTPELAKPHEAS